MTYTPEQEQDEFFLHHATSTLMGESKRYQNFGLLHDEDSVLLAESVIEGNINKAVGVASLGTNDPLGTVLGVEANASALRTKGYDFLPAVASELRRIEAYGGQIEKANQAGTKVPDALADLLVGLPLEGTTRAVLLERARAEAVFITKLLHATPAARSSLKLDSKKMDAMRTYWKFS